jgi:hypothetical protein
MVGFKDVSIRQLSVAVKGADGRRTPGTPGATTVIQGSIQPDQKKMLNASSNDIRERKKCCFYTYENLNTADSVQPHQVQFNGDWYDIDNKHYWEDLIPHYEYSLIKIKEGA